MELEFGELEKRDIPPDMMVKMIESAVNMGAVVDIVEKRDLYERAGLPMSKDYTDQAEQMANMMAMNPPPMIPPDPSMMPQEPQMPTAPAPPTWNTSEADHAKRPNDFSQYRGTEPKSPYQKVTELKKKYSRKPLK